MSAKLKPTERFVHEVSPQEPLFEVPANWQEHWRGMPEFVQEKQKPYSQIVFRFVSEEDLQEFAKLIGQKLTNKTKSAWYPFVPHRSEVKRNWQDD